MWDIPGPGHEPLSPLSAGRLSTTAPPGKPCGFLFYSKLEGLMITVTIPHYYQILTLVSAFRPFFSSKLQTKACRRCSAFITKSLAFSSINFILSAVWKPLTKSKRTEPAPPAGERRGSLGRFDPSYELPLLHRSSAICSVRLDRLQVTHCLL